MVIKPTRKVPTVPEEEEEEVVQDLSATLVKIETELDTSHSFPAPFEMTTTSTDSSLAKIVKQSQGEQWLLVQAPIAMGLSPSPSKSVKGVEDTVTPDVFPGNSAVRVTGGGGDEGSSVVPVHGPMSSASTNTDK